MPFITFIYRIGNNKTTYYGKYVTDYISDDHDGLDDEIKPLLVYGINMYRKNNNRSIIPKKNIHIGILSLSIGTIIPTYSSENEIKCFDFYCTKCKNVEEKTYVNGKILLVE